MNSKKVCITIDWYLPGTNSGGPVRSITNLVESLSEVDFYIITRNTDYCSSEPYQEIKSDSWNQRSSNESVYYFSHDSLSKSNLKKVIFELCPDCLYINGIYSKLFSIWPLQIVRKLEIKTIVASRGMLSEHALKVKPFKKQLFLAFMRWSKAYADVHFHATSIVEESDVNKRTGKNLGVTFIPNLSRQSKQNNQPICKNQGQLKLISIGRIAPEKGIIDGIRSLQFVKGIIQFDIYGSIYDQDYWMKCKAVINELPEEIEVIYHGACPSDQVAEKLSQAHVLLLPSKGENYGHSIVESLSQGRPVIISENTPWKNLESSKAGFDVEEERLSKAIQFFVDADQKIYDEWLLGAFNYFNSNIQNQTSDYKKKYIELLTN
jgi:glycosyltransferase involved in cell wall biosynthesis